MKKVITLALIAAGIFATSFLNIEVKVSANQSYACDSSDGCSD